jgi:hypothetical protein
MQELGPCINVEGRSERCQSHGWITRPADAVRLGLRRQAHPRPDASAFHGLPAAAHGSGNGFEAARKTKSRRTAAGAAHAMRLALRRQAHSYGDTETLSSMSTAAKGDGARRVPVEVGGRGFCQDPASQFSETSQVGDRKRVTPLRPAAAAPIGPKRPIEAPGSPNINKIQELAHFAVRKTEVFRTPKTAP